VPTHPPRMVYWRHGGKFCILFVSKERNCIPLI
jgi:hypothetical protein